MDDEPKVEQLENRIDKLESTIEKMMPSRRDALKMGGAALAGGSLMAGTSSAGTNQVGTIGSASQPVDLESEDINNADTVTTDTINAQGVDAVSANIDSATIDTLGNRLRQDATALNNNRGAVKILNHAFDLAVDVYATFFEYQKTDLNEAIHGFSSVTSIRESNGTGYNESGTFRYSSRNATWGTAGSTAVQISNNVRLQIDSADASILKFQIRPTEGFHNTACDVLSSGRPLPTITDP